MELISFYQNMGSFLSLILVVALWDLFWKAIAMWRAAKRDSKVWFVLLLVLNTAGLLPILYIVFTSDFKKFKKGSSAQKKQVEAKKEAAVLSADTKVAKDVKVAKVTKKSSKKKKVATKKNKASKSSKK